MRKARGPNFKSAIEHTIAKEKRRAKQPNGTVFSGRGNLSRIGQPPPVVAGGNAAPGISKKSKQQHPGKATLEKFIVFFILVNLQEFIKVLKKLMNALVLILKEVLMYSILL